MLGKRMLFLLGAASTARQPLPISTWLSLSRGDWRIESPVHPDSFIFRVDVDSTGAEPGICSGGCCGGGKKWYIAAWELPWAEDVGFNRGGSGRHPRALMLSPNGVPRLSSWHGKGQAALIPTKAIARDQPGWRLKIRLASPGPSRLPSAASRAGTL